MLVRGLNDRGLSLTCMLLLLLHNGGMVYAVTCDTGTKQIGDKCQCSADVVDGKVYIAGILDTAVSTGYGSEMKKHFEMTAQLINDHSDGFWDNILAGTELKVTTANSGCDSALAGPAYWDKRRNWGQPLHGVVGGRCSGASMAIARIAALEQVLQIAPSATSSKLNDRVEFPYFYRTAAPDDSTGEIGALVSMLRHFGWDRVTILVSPSTLLPPTGIPPGRMMRCSTCGSLRPTGWDLGRACAQGGGAFPVAGYCSVDDGSQIVPGRFGTPCKLASAYLVILQGVGTWGLAAHGHRLGKQRVNRVQRPVGRES